MSAGAKSRSTISSMGARSEERRVGKECRARWKTAYEIGVTGVQTCALPISKADNAAQGNEKAASLVNAYNAFVLQWILKNYPTESIWQLKDSFSGKRNDVGGRKVALDDIEHGSQIGRASCRERV